ncbi:uncharacterized protein LOC123667433 [Melitaea cinxia]|uniref:uncharacterized protein LOC123667433 n=1 Tax=Melitaea cinxia TaxID=113334 RepID=UPI001E271DF4|nr:uncharacterized protein LOC123667433 [Melitaea cinxia]
MDVCPMRLQNDTDCLHLSFQSESKAEPSRNDLSDLVNLLSKKYSGNKPLVVILDSGSLGKYDKNQKYRAVTPESSDDEGAWNVPHLLLQNQKAKLLLGDKKRTTKSLLQLKTELKLKRIQRLRDSQDRNINDKNEVRSPIVKQLLRISNRIQCDAKDECQDQCSDRYEGNKADKCNIQCEVKYDCEEEKDPCEDNECGDSCGGGDCAMSTKGEILVNEEPKCKRC